MMQGNTHPLFKMAAVMLLFRSFGKQAVHHGKVSGTTLWRRGMASAASFRYKDLEIELTKNPQRKPEPSELVFGKNFTDHMLTIEWTSQEGWKPPRITPLQPLQLHPGAKALHYSVELFEGMKAYRGIDDKLRLFRPEANMERMNNSAARAALPSFDGEELIQCISKLIEVDRDWVPAAKDCSLYIRPTLIGTEPTLGVSQAEEAMLFVLLGPVGAYFKTGTFNPVSLMADPQYIRAFKGGVGNYKLGSNYGPTIRIQKEAERRGCQQVLWLYGDDHQLTEVGTMNIFMYWENESGEPELVTPPLEGIILPGVTRRSLLDLARGWNECKVTERTFTMHDLVKGLEDNRVKELFGAGTACVVCPIDRILYGEKDLHIPTMDTGAVVCRRLYQELTDIQFGRVPHDWVRSIES
ncbi:PREDICTED: branched-chain-amino-acid aminotransferase, cytosolic-like [Branchiostoma belcheri]|uniref:Branched-chain-amino-acid aminotransferase n=1 Tax=Branchiostoma belcheri TaxID=7741 RepID=A0A6P5AE21_BRABE|nr:PREDICTED: branched-chain-amino-acid aminotransferase, cytosolic-like [Branchiostoma belcheri]